MEATIERLVEDIMTRDRVSRGEAERFVVILLEELRAVLAEQSLPRRDFAAARVGLEGRLVAP